VLKEERGEAGKGKSSECYVDDCCCRRKGSEHDVGNGAIMAFWPILGVAHVGISDVSSAPFAWNTSSTSFWTGTSTSARPTSSGSTSRPGCGLAPMWAPSSLSHHQTSPGSSTASSFSAEYGAALFYWKPTVATGAVTAARGIPPGVGGKDQIAVHG
jgi:hypothetical protein